MDLELIEEKTFKGIDFTRETFEIAQYELCTFVNCNFHRGSFSEARFEDCVFEACDLSLLSLSGTYLQEVLFKDCKLVGLHFDTCNPFLFKVSFEHCDLQAAVFQGMDLKNTTFLTSDLSEADFTEALLTTSQFSGSNLLNTIFHDCDLCKVDFSTASNLLIDPERNQLEGACFSPSNIEGLLSKYKIRLKI
jgi:uncharacterized protein YjbI with pentapeptide repeats